MRSNLNFPWLKTKSWKAHSSKVANKFISINMQKKKELHAKGPEEKKVKEDNTPITKNTELNFSSSTKINVQLLSILGDSTGKITSARFCPDDKYVAAAYDNAEVHIFNIKTGKTVHLLKGTEVKGQRFPFTCVRWRPQVNNNKIKNILVTTNSHGEIQHWHPVTGKCLSSVREDIKECHISCLDYNRYATKLAIVGTDPALKIYDEETRQMELKLTSESTAIPGHTNRVFSVKYDPEDSNILVTGGWDQKVLIWDVRTKCPVRTFAGPLICADGIDIFEEVVLTGSWRENEQVQMWDLGTGKLISTVKWESGIKVSNDPCYVYANQFSKIDGSLILAGGSNSNEVRIFDRNKLDSLVCVIYDLSREVTTVDFSNNGDKFLTAGSDGMVRVFNMNIIA